jgi:glyoxylase-like metal-dependent hydrolase (beta-lactamase superfamily II)
MHLSEHVVIHAGAVNVGVLHDGDRALLFDCGEGSVVSTLVALGVRHVERVLFTHHHRDQASGVARFARKGARICVPEEERAWFESVDAYWNDPARRWHLYDDHPHPWMLTEPVSVHEVLRDGDSFVWGPARITAVSTPAHTDGSLTYVVDVDGRRFAFTGDLIADVGRVWDIYSLQKKGETATDYHGFLGARKQLLASLDAVLAHAPDALVPSHGVVMRNPAQAVDALRERLEVAYDRYVAGSALRYYFPQMFTDYEGKPNHFAFRPHLDTPAFLRHYGTTWVILSETGEAFVMDCGSTHVIEQIQRLIEKGEATRVTGFWITHYHDDHVDAVPEFQKRFDCVTRADAVVANVIAHPLSYRIPCVSPSVARIDHATSDGESWQWNEFRMTAYFFPGQTYYHGGLYVEGRGVRMFFTGDSFTPSGMDDYCAANRNLLGDGVGYDRCLAILSSLRPTHLFNCHVGPAWEFRDEDIAFLRANLAERESLFGELVYWEHANYGLDPHWVRCYPYEQTIRPGETATLQIIFSNHTTEARTATCKPVLPGSWGYEVEPATVTLSSKSEGRATFRVPVPTDAKVGRTMVPVEVTYGSRALGQFREAILVVG